MPAAAAVGWRRRDRAARRPGRRATRRSRAADARARPTPRSSRGCSGPGRLIGGAARARRCGAPVPRLDDHRTPETAAATSEMTAICLVAGGRLPRAGRGARSPRGCWRRRWPRSRPSAASSPRRTWRAATRRFSSASTPLVLTVAMSCTLLFSTTTIDHAVTQQRHAALTGELAITSTGPGLPPAALADVPRHARRALGGRADADDARPEPRRRPTTPSPRRSSTAVAGGGPRRRRNRRVAGGAARQRDRPRSPPRRRRARPRRRARARSRSATAPAPTPPSWRSTTATLAFGDALLAPELAAGHRDHPAARDDPRPDRPPGRRRRGACRAGSRYPGLRVSDRASLATASRRRPRDEPLARPAVRRDDLRLHVDRRGQHADR